MILLKIGFIITKDYAMTIYITLKEVEKDCTTLGIIYGAGESVLKVAEINGKILFVAKTEQPNEFLVKQHPECEAELTSYSEMEKVIKASRAYQNINELVIDLIRERYGYDDEIKLLNIALADAENEEYLAYRAYVSECRDHGRIMKFAAGLSE